MSCDEAKKKILEMIQGFRLTKAIFCAAELRIADRLQPNAKNASQLADECKVLPGMLERLLRALASLGVFHQLPTGEYQNTPLSLCLVSTRPDSQWAFAILAGNERYKAFDKLLDTLRTGTNGFELAYGLPLFDFLKENPESARIFYQAMTGLHGSETAQMLEVLDLGQFGVLADIGGGNASLLIEALGRYPRLKGVLFDLPHVVANAAKEIAQAGLADRIAIQPGDFFKEIPLVSDAYLLRHILHDWPDDQCLLILRKVREHFPSGAKLLVVEYVLEAGNEPHPGKWLDVGMLVATGGRERTAEEFKTLFHAAGFRLEAIHSTPSQVCILVGQ